MPFESPKEYGLGSSTYGWVGGVFGGGRGVWGGGGVFGGGRGVWGGEGVFGWGRGV